ISAKKAAENLQSLQGYDPSEFTFANGVFCDVKEKLCRDDRYFGVDGKRSGKINQITTKMLFMCRE
ncbi:TPA: YcgJ family protein, partial [Escherichia coli]|nr:YcgJ family protein [Escherichia coli]